MIRQLTIFLFVILNLTSHLNGQTSCSPTLIAQDVFYPNTTSSASTATGSILYLCGPNTVVYDTNTSCRSAYLNSGCTLYHKSMCAAGTYFFLKNNSSVIILPGTNNSIWIMLEPTATYTNMSTSPVVTVACSAVSFPTLNCSTGIFDLNGSNQIKIYPNPVSNSLFVSIENSDFKTSEIEITNTLGQTVLKSQYKSEIDVSQLSNGCYMIKIISPTKQHFHTRFVKQ